MLLDYVSIYPEAIIGYHFIDIYLYIDYDVAYLVQPKARSQAAGHYFFSNKPDSLSVKPTPRNNGPVHTECVTIKRVVSSTAESEVDAIQDNGKTTCPIRFTLAEFSIHKVQL